VLAPLVLALGLVAIIWFGRKAWYCAPLERPVTLFALGTFAVISLHSIVDYPLRNMALAVMTGVAAGLLAGIARQGREGRQTQAT